MNSFSFAGTASISAMDLRKEPGRFLDRVSYRGESFIIERAGKPKAVLVPIREFAEMKRLREETKKRLFLRVDKVYEKTAKLDSKKIELTIEKAIVATRRKLSKLG